MNIGVIGVGGVGGYFGGKLTGLLTDKANYHLSFIGRGEHLRAIQQDGLILECESEGEYVSRPSLATDDFSALLPLDICLVCVKEPDLAPALRKLAHAIRENSIVLPLLNGVDIYARVRSVIRQAVILPACVYLGTHIERPGKVIQKGGSGRIMFGPDPAHPDADLTRLTGLFDKAKIKYELTAQIEFEIWKKFIFICGYGLVAAAHKKTLGEILDDERLRAETLTVMTEVIATGAAVGVSFPDDIAETSLLRARSFPHDAKTSFQRDFEQSSRKDERDLFAGTIIRLAAQRQLPVPKVTELARFLETRKPAVWKDPR